MQGEGEEVAAAERLRAGCAMQHRAQRLLAWLRTRLAAMRSHGSNMAESGAYVCARARALK